MKTRKGLGFTLVELIVVIILLAIISAYAASRYIGVGSFSAFAIQDSVISVARQVQLNRMQSNTSTLNDSFVLSISTACIGSKESCANPIDSRSDWVMNDSVSFSAMPNIATIEFDLLGNPLGAASAGVDITIQGGNSHAVVSVCPNGLISTSGCF
ncbi:putative MSHA pilin protein MshC [Vibrio ichthyoenteri ATCC 700023]|uniref:Putative MSHA pilin protein MshC n=1 Tax=Vibrio ichthyoenteri ATCC 700023 TaxID=870968 RepID=F9S1H9_9VIBR|nr:prepilin-type N-terminal cleavage/methylation domain-containing protein [Vibrio ichthyoenteri]EGU41685.1 putative MSHA pilin protein MshC [Vibrio ichthyoenteri ATCC 700023]